ncbi:MAG TPA: hypothetical protein VL053_04310, partial [Arachidicoccus sp.]|nr:hypothetical protein [Arachidicoccus sp.]
MKQYIAYFFLFGILFTSSCGYKEYIHLTPQEQKKITELSQRYDCEVTVNYNYFIRNGKMVPRIDSSEFSKYTISFEWEDKKSQNSICEKDTSYLRQFALNLLPELFKEMRYIKDFPAIE